MGLHLDPTTLAIIGGLLSLAVTGAGSLFSASISRNVKGLDKTLEQINGKLDKLGADIGNLRERVAVLEDRAKVHP